METIACKSIEDFWEKFKGKLSTRACVVSDIDNVWFNGLLDFRMWISKFSHKRLQLMCNIIRKTNFLLFTNRGWLGIWKCGYIDQIEYSIGVGSLIRYDTSEDFLSSKDFAGLGVVKYAQKPKQPSLGVLEYLASRYEKVYYIAARDFAWGYTDLDLVRRANKKLKKNILKKITFVDIVK